jgi:hypothetical protein
MEEEDFLGLTQSIYEEIKARCGDNEEIKYTTSLQFLIHTPN